MNWKNTFKPHFFKKVPPTLLITFVLFTIVFSFVGWIIIDDDMVSAFMTSGPVQKSDLIQSEGVKNVINISFLNEDRKEFYLSDFRGKVVLLYLWAGWCKNYQKDLVTLNHLQEKIGMRKFVVIPVSLDQFEMKRLRHLYDSHNIDNLNIYQDQFGRSLVDLGIVKSLPMAIFIDKDGREVARYHGKVYANSRRLTSFVREQIKKANKDFPEKSTSE